MSAAQPVAKSEQQLFEAIRAGDASRVIELLGAAPSLARARTPDGTSGVLMAIYCGHAEMVPLFEERGVVLNLFEACAAGRLERVSALVSGDPSLAGGYSDDGYPALGLAVYFSHEDIAGMLIESGADVNAASRNSQRVTPLHAAAARHNTRLAGVLLARGADPDASQAGGITTRKSSSCCSATAPTRGRKRPRAKPPPTWPPSAGTPSWRRSWHDWRGERAVHSLTLVVRCSRG